MKKKLFSCAIMLLVSIMTCMAQTMKSHTVQRGETLESIAQKYGVTVEAIKQANPGMGGYFYVGMGLKIPNKVETILPDTPVSHEAEQKQPVHETTGEDKQEHLIVETPPSVPTTKDYAMKELQVENTTSVEDSDNGFYEHGMDFIFTLRPKDKIYGFHWGCQVRGKYFYFAEDMYWGKDLNPATYALGLGLGSKWHSGPLLLQGSLYPYAGLYMFEYNIPKVTITSRGNIYQTTETKTEYKFAYGVHANFGLGLHIYTRKTTGSKTYLTVGYYMTAPEFETVNMVENGSWMVGITTTWQ